MTAVEIAEALAGRRSGAGWVARCLAHDDREASLSIRDGERGPLVTCHAGCERSAIIAALRARGLWPTRAERRRARGDVETCECTPRRTAYRIAGGVTHVRLDHEAPCRLGKRMWWEPRLGVRVTELPLYRVELLDEHDSTETVVVTEGERACDAVAELGVAAVGTVTGASAIPHDDMLRVLRDHARVVLWPDHDEPGREHMRRIAARLEALGCADVRVIEWGESKGDDAANLVEREGDAAAARVAELVAAARPWRDVLSAPEPDRAAREPHLAAVPAYPTSELPEPLRSLVVAGERAGLPAEYVAAGGLGALAYCALDCRVVVSDTWVEAPAIWAVALGPASTAKSPGVRYGWAPVWAAEDALRTADIAALERWRAEPAKLRGDPPARTTRMVSDATVEALVRRLAAAGPQVLVVDELRSWLGALGRYGAGTAAQRDLGHYLSMWDAHASLVYDRVGGDTSLVAPEPAVAIVGTLQTEDHRLLGGVETGLRARWLPHLYRGALPERVEGCGTVPCEWTDTLTDLTRQRPRLRLSLAHEARMLWTEAGARWRAEAEDASPGVRAATGKSERQALRVALVLAVGMREAQHVPADAMRAAIAIVDYVLDVWRALPEGEELVLSRAAERTSVAVDRLASWLERRPDRQATRDRILRAQVAGIRTAAALDAVIDHYEATYPGSVASGESTSQGGRRGTVVRAPTRSRADEIPRDRGISGAYSAAGAAEKTEVIRACPRDLPRDLGTPDGPEGSAPPEGSTRVWGAL